MNVSEYARHRGVDRKAVRNAVETGRISRNPNGTIDQAKADEDWENNTDPARTQNGKLRYGRSDDISPKSPTDDLTRSTQALYMKARASREMHNGELARLKTERLRGALVSRSEVNFWVANYFSQIRHACEHLPHRMAGQLAAETDAEAVFELLETEIHSVFQKFANGQLEAKEVDAS